jgi:hypothetical protein
MRRNEASASSTAPAFANARKRQKISLSRRYSAQYAREASARDGSSVASM